VRRGVQGFLDFIAVHESRGNWNAYYGAVDNADDPPFTRMTIDAVLAWQDGRRFSACGKYQVIRKTMLSLKAEMGLSGAEVYDEGLQDRMATTLLRRRGLDDFLAGRMGRKVFALSVAREWAALPGVLAPFFRRSVYAGDGVNRALVGVDDYLATIDRLGATA
jgi:muramidase (phage lysozyme)